jgi:HAD superfamily PSPase-like hydrolase
VQKVIFIDVDGTLTTSLSAWELAHHHFAKVDPTIIDKMNANTKLYYQGDITYNEWARLDVELWINSEYHELEQALLPPKLIPGAKEGISLLKDHGFMVVLVSGGIDILVDAVKKEVNADLSYSNRIGHKNGIIDGSLIIEVGDSKADTLEVFSQTYNYDVSDAYAIGDNTNDIDMFKRVKYSLAINTRIPEVIKIASHHIMTENFVDAVKIIINHKKIAEN